jgi:hypothetical protein
MWVNVDIDDHYTLSKFAPNKRAEEIAEMAIRQFVEALPPEKRLKRPLDPPAPSKLFVNVMRHEWEAFVKLGPKPLERLREAVKSVAGTDYMRAGKMEGTIQENKLRQLELIFPVEFREFMPQADLYAQHCMVRAAVRKVLAESGWRP